MHFTDIFVKRPVLATVVSLLILLAGLQAVFTLPIRQYPEVADTKIEITCGTTKIVMEPMKMSIETMSLSFKTQDFSTDSMMSSHKAAGVMDIKGGVVKINS